METDIIRWARECGWVIYDDMPYMDCQAIQAALIERLERFAALVRADERIRFADKCIDIVAFNGGSVEIEADIRSLAGT